MSYVLRDNLLLDVASTGAAAEVCVLVAKLFSVQFTCCCRFETMGIIWAR